MIIFKGQKVQKSIPKIHAYKNHGWIMNNFAFLFGLIKGSLRTKQPVTPYTAQHIYGFHCFGYHALDIHVPYSF